MSHYFPRMDATCTRLSLGGCFRGPRNNIQCRIPDLGAMQIIVANVEMWSKRRMHSVPDLSPLAQRDSLGGYQLASRLGFAFNVDEC